MSGQSSGLVAMGLAFAVASTLLTNVGILFQKLSADTEADKPLCSRWRFWLGFTLNLGSEAGLTTAALALAPMSVIAPLGGLSVVFNALLARFGVLPGIREEMSRRDWASTACILVGVVAVAYCGPAGVDPATYNATLVADLPAAFAQPVFVGYAAVSVAIVLAWLALWKGGACVGALRPYTPRADSQAAAFGSSLTAALCAGFSTVFLKVLALALSEYLSARRLPGPVVPICGAALLVCAPLQLYLLNMTLASGTASFTIPLYLSLTMILTSACGGVLFSEFTIVLERAPRPLYLCGYLCAVVVVLLGLVALSSSQVIA